MATLLSSLFSIKTTDAEVRRRGQILVFLALGIFALILIIIIPLSLSRPSVGRAANLVVVSVVFGLVTWLGRQGHVAIGAWILIIGSILGSVSGTLINPDAQLNLFFLVVSVLLASVLLAPTQIWIVLAASLVALTIVGAALPLVVREVTGWGETVPIVVLVTTITALIAFIGARSTAQALQEVSAARQQAEEASHQLAASNATLEQRVEERTTALRQIAEEHRAAASALQTSLQTQQALNRIIADQAVPVIPVSAGTIVVPLIGNISGERADQILTTILTQVERTHARTVILDVTGVALVDTHIAAGLLRVAQATRLMGTTTVLAGIRPEVAQALVSLGVDLADLCTVATLREAL